VVELQILFQEKKHTER